MTSDAPPDREGASIRPFRWDDTEALFDLIQRVAGRAPRDRARSLEVFNAELRLPRADPPTNALLAFHGGDPAGFAMLTLEPNIGRTVARFGVDPLHRRQGLGRRLLDAAAGRAREAGTKRLHVQAPADDAICCKLLDSAGMRPVRRYWRMQHRPAPAYLGGDYRPLPEGFSIRRFEAGKDEQVLTDLQNAAFEGSWGFAPNSVDEIAARVALPNTDPEDILLLDDGTRTVGYNWTRIEDSGDRLTGVISMTGVHPDVRGHGLGLAIVTAGLRHLSEQGATEIFLEVDSANKPARRLYRDLGFRKIAETIWYEMLLR